MPVVNAADHLGLVWQIYYRMPSAGIVGIDSTNIVAAGMEAVVRCASEWRSDHPVGATFASYAYTNIYGAMCRATRAEWNHRSMRARSSPGRGKWRLKLFSEIGDAFVKGSAREFARQDHSAEDHEWDEEFNAILIPHCRKLDRRCRQMLGLSLNGESLNQIASKFNITRERVRQIIATALNKLRRAVVSEQKARLLVLLNES